MGQITNIITFCVSRRRRKMYCGHARLCVCLSVCLCVCLSAAVPPHYCTDPDVTWGHGRGCPVVVHYWADLQSGDGLRCCGNITRTLVTSLRPSHDIYRITHGCECSLPGHCTPTQCQSHCRAGLFVTDSLVTTVGYTSCQPDRQVELAASIAHWRDQTVCHK